MNLQRLGEKKLKKSPILKNTEFFLKKKNEIPKWAGLIEFKATKILTAILGVLFSQKLFKQMIFHS